MKNRSDKLVNITFSVNLKMYEASVFLNRPTAILLPDQSCTVYTSLGPKPDTSSQKNRYRNLIDPNEEMETRIEQKEGRFQPRSIYDQSKHLNKLTVVKHSEGKPFVCNTRFLVLANPK